MQTTLWVQQKVPQRSTPQRSLTTGGLGSLSITIQQRRLRTTAEAPRSISSCTISSGLWASSSSWRCSSSSSTPVAVILVLPPKLFPCTLHHRQRLSTFLPTPRRETCGPSSHQFLQALFKVLDKKTTRTTTTATSRTTTKTTTVTTSTKKYVDPALPCSSGFCSKCLTTTKNNNQQQ